MVEVLSRTAGPGGPQPDDYRVAGGDTLGAIARDHGVSLAALLRANPQLRDHPDLIRPGEIVHLPALAGEATRAAPAGGNSYEVRRGDTLSGIAERHGLSTAALLRANPALRGHPNLIRPGEIVHLPAQRSAAAAAVPARHHGGHHRLDTSRGATATSPVALPAAGAGNPATIAAKYLHQTAASLEADQSGALHMKPATDPTHCCANFVSAVLVEAGQLPRSKQTTTVSELNRTLRARGWTEVSPAAARPGDVVIIQGMRHGERVSHTEIVAGPNLMIGSNNPSRGAPQRISYEHMGWALEADARILRAPGGAAAASAAPAPAAPAAPAPADNAREALLQRLGDVISGGEGGYESYNTGTRGVPQGHVGHSYMHPKAGTVTGMTINQILATEKLPGTDPRRMFATGKYQTIIPTLRDARDAMGLTGNELYTPAMQERVFREYLVGRGDGGLARFLFEGRGTVDDAVYTAAQIWASIAVPAGRLDNNGAVANGKTSYFEQAGVNHANLQATAALRRTLSEVQSAR